MNKMRKSLGGGMQIVNASAISTPLKDLQFCV